MRSTLTRLVFRRLIRNEPILHRDCLNRPALVTVYNVQHTQRWGQRRSLFGFMRGATRQVKEVDLAPGLDKMMDLSKKLSEGMRPPDSRELADAFRLFFSITNDRSKRAGKWTGLQDFQAAYALETFEHLCSHAQEDGTPWLSAGDIVRILERIWTGTAKPSKPGIGLSRALYKEVKLRFERDKTPADHIYRRLAPRHHIIALCQLGLLAEGRMCFEKEWQPKRDLNPSEKETLSPTLSDLVTRLILGASREGNEQEMLRAWKLTETYPIAHKDHRALNATLQYYAKRGDMQQMKHWSNEFDKSEIQVDPVAAKAVLDCCWKNQDLDFGWSFVRSLEANATPSIWREILVWTAKTGQGVEAIDQLVANIANINPDLNPDSSTINALVEFAVSREDPYLAERYIAMGRKYDVEPNATTFLYMMDYRLSANDINGARAAYKSLQGEQVTDGEDLPRINKLIQAMCSSKRRDFDTIMEVVEDLNERRARFEPETVSALCLLHLECEELHDVVDLLQTHTFHFSTEQRAHVRDVFVAYCLDRRNSIARVWDAYMIFHQIFDESDREIRTQIMNEFFTRRRADMACHVFNHMRQHSRPNTHATTDTYIDALAGIAKLSDTESLEVIHNQLKLDMNVEPSTRLNNALMLAYTGCGEPRRAFDFWADIINSREGPSYNSILIAFRVCEKAPWGDEDARPIWAKLKKMDVEISRDVFAAYLGSLAGNEAMDEAKEMVETVEEEFGFKADALILGTMFNATNNMNKQGEIGVWIKESYPDVWDELEKMGSRKNQRFGTKLFRLDRTLTP